MTVDMKLKIIIKKEAAILAALYDLYCPYNPIITSPHIYYLNPEFAKILYIKYLLEKEDAWDKTFTGILEEKDSNITKTLKSIEIYNWNTIKKMLIKKSKEITNLNNEKIKNFKDYSKKIFGFKKYFKEIYLILGFNPIIKASYGNALTTIKTHPVISCFTNEKQNPQQILDVIYHEILHKLIKLNNIKLEEKIEEVIIDQMCPKGYLSKLLGLSEKIHEEHLLARQEWLREEYEKLTGKIKEYFEKQIYNEKTIFNFLNLKSI